MISKRARSMDASGIRKVFDLAANLKAPVNLSIGIPDFDVPDAAKAAMKEAVDAGKNRYTPSGGIPLLREAVRRRCRERHGFEPGDVMITSGTSGGLTLALLATVDPGDEVLVPDPFFVSYRQLVLAAGGTPVFYDTYPDFRLRVAELERVATERTKVLVLNSPANPTGVTLTEEEVRSACTFATKRGLVVLSDEVYEPFSYGERPVSAARFHANTVTVNGWSKSHAMTGWRVGWAAGPGDLINEMIKLQQFTFVCAPAPAQHAALATIDLDTTGIRETYAAKRDLACGILEEAFDLVKPDGAFYVFPKAPAGLTGTDFVKRAIAENVLVIPGGVFSTRDTHFRISFATADETIREGCGVLARLASEGRG